MSDEGHTDDAGQSAPTSGAGGHGKQRFFGPTNLALANRISIVALAAVIAIMGFTAYRTIPKESSPEIEIPMISVSTIYPGVAPKDMETLVTRVLEDEINTIPEIIELTSVSDMGYSNVLAEFDSDMDMEDALQKVRDKVDLAKPELPDAAEEPIISEFNFADFPIMQVNVSGEYGLVRLKEVAEDLQERLEQIPSILDVRLSGGLAREVKVDVDLAKLQFYNVAFGDVIAAIASENVTVPGGAIKVGAQDFLVRVDGEFRDTDIINDIVVETRSGRPIYVRDVARVEFGFRDRESYARLDGADVVTLDIIKRSGENVIETATAVKDAVAQEQALFPPTTVVKVTSDTSEDIEMMVSSLENNIISGLLLVVAVLLFFLGVRNASFVGISIPMSMLLSFIVLGVLGISMNMVVLFSLILALGMLVDNAIVVVENIYRHIEQGHDNVSAARLATGEVALPIITSTLTTLCAFLPMLFWPGIVGEFMGYLPATLIVTLASSLFVALVIVPTLCAMFMRLDGAPRSRMPRAGRRVLIAGAALFLLVVGVSNPLTAGLFLATGVAVVALHRFVLDRAARWFQVYGLPRIITGYEGQLRWALRHRAIVLGACVAVFVGAIMLFGALNAGVEYFPESIPPRTVFARVDVPAGTAPEFTNAIANRIESQLTAISGMRDAKSVVSTVRATSGGASMFESSGEGAIAINFLEFDKRSTDVFETLGDMQEQLGAGIAGADIKVEKQANGVSTGKPVNIELVGPDVDELKRLSDRALAVLKTAPVYPKLEGLESDMTRGRPELVVDVDRERAALFDLSTSEVGVTVRTAIQGSEAAKYRSGNDEYDIVVRLDEIYRSNLDALNDFTVSKDGRQIPLPSVADWHVEEGLGTVRRKDLDRVATVSSDVRTGYQINAVVAEVQQTLAPFAAELPTGYSLRYTGQEEDQQEAMEFLSRAFVIALILIALILMSQFNSVLKPLIIMTSVLMSTVGVLVGLVLFRMPFGIIMTGVGVISLAGIVVNNAIVLIDYIDLLRDRDGLSRDEALLQGGATRFRPVILTAITTVFGLVPLAIGFNFDFFGLFSALQPNVFWGGEQAAWWGPMAIAVIAGLTFATLLTLIVVPVLYSVLDDLGAFVGRLFLRDATPAAAAPQGGGFEGVDIGSRDGGRRRRLAAVLSRVRSPASY